jgi:hypothetical protein
MSGHLHTETSGGKDITMGDRNPKSLQKQAAQKQSRTNDVNQKKQAAIATQQATKTKMVAAKKK